MEDNYIFCTECGKMLIAESKFCSGCGSEVYRDSEPCVDSVTEENENNLVINNLFEKLSQLVDTTEDRKDKGNIKIILSKDNNNFMNQARLISLKSILKKGFINNDEYTILCEFFKNLIDEKKQKKTEEKEQRKEAERILKRNAPQESVAPRTPITKKGKVKELKKEAAANGIACCPKCGCTSLSSDKKGFGIGKAVVGAAVTGGIGLVLGNKGAKKVRITCLNCGHQWWAGK